MEIVVKKPKHIQIEVSKLSRGQLFTDHLNCQNIYLFIEDWHDEIECVDLTTTNIRKFHKTAYVYKLKIAIPLEVELEI